MEFKNYQGDMEMDYDFSGLCADQIEKLNKRLTSLNKAFVKEYKMALNVINHPVANEKRSETLIEIEDLLRDQIGKSEIFYTETFNKVQKCLSKYL
jgi:hypothetical protein